MDANYLDKKMENIHEGILGLSGLSATDRLVYITLSCIRKAQNSDTATITQSEIGRYCNLSRQAVSRSINSLRGYGLIDYYRVANTTVYSFDYYEEGNDINE